MKYFLAPIIWILKKIRDIIFFVVGQVIRTIISFIVFIALIVLLFAVIYEKNKTPESAPKNYSYVEIDMSQNYSERSQPYIASLFNEEVGYYKLVKTLKRIGQDKNVKGVIFKLDDYSLGRAQTEELGKIIKKYLADKETYSYSKGLSKASYYFAVNTKKIVMPDTVSATSSITGYHIESPFYKRLATKLGIKFEVVHMGNYKSYGENLVSTSMSSYSKENLMNLLDKINNDFVANVAKKRELKNEIINEQIENGSLVSVTPQELLQNKYIDGLEFYHDLVENLGGEKEITTLNSYIKQQTNKNNSKNYIGLVVLNGEITDVPSVQTRGEQITEDGAINLLKKAFEDDEVKGVVVRVDSPGGSALVSDVIYNFIKNSKVRKNAGTKPVYVSMGSTAASGGYFISAAGDKIFADETTMTGSIGVVSILPNGTELLNKIGIDMDVISKGKNSGLYSMTQVMNEERLNTILKSNEQVYKEFKSVVAENRKMSMEQVEELAQGRVWLGKEAVQNKLVDDIASLDEVVEQMAKELKFAEDDYNVVAIQNIDPESELRMYSKLFRMKLSNNLSLEIKTFLKEKFNISIDEKNNVVEVVRPLIHNDIVERLSR